MKIYHVTDMANLPGILEIGLQPTKPRLPGHRKALKALYDGQPGPKKLIYTWEFRNDRRTRKIVQDVAYWHVWGWRLNGMLEGIEPQSKEDRVDLPDRKDPPMEPTVFAVLTSHVPKTSRFVLEPGYFVHHHWVKTMLYRAYDRMDRRRQHTEPLVLIASPIAAWHLQLWATVIVDVERKNRRWHLTTSVHRYQRPKPLMRKSNG